MIYSTPRESRACACCCKINHNSDSHGTLLSHNVVQIEMRALPKMALNYKSLIFGASIVRRGGTCFQLCKEAAFAINLVNRLWYGRALVSMRTHHQESLRVAARHQKINTRDTARSAIAA
jgi:hypothetical protein